ncbi:uncharacterized protein BJ212DRAFT_1343531 [Suillus subaureus]|uniref:Uncharacterized protein n=1 Tax=Suillus subaureus TaxID=48587 RepID=A0A9P7EGC7_9AGAM|nr:uncharacterized protein BJ212DRAFT_1343531 [Suillus subaureus]KAG1819860.1 hypothetical protein BJ212DRAFT_1343531 [Suillus subaureus]
MLLYNMCYLAHTQGVEVPLWQAVHWVIHGVYVVAESLGVGRTLRSQRYTVTKSICESARQ